MKKKGAAILLALWMGVSSIGTVVGQAAEIQGSGEIQEIQNNASSETEKQLEEKAIAFQGELVVDEAQVSTVDEEGIVTFVDMSNDDTMIHDKGRASEAQIVNLRKKSGVLDYKEVGTGAAGYTAGSYGADAAYLGTSNGKVRFMIGGVIGEADSANVQIISKSSAKSVSYYLVSGGRLYHYISTNVNDSKYLSKLDNGPAPSYLKSGTKYYSYDGHYFYTEQKFNNMLEDYKNKRRSSSVNATNPFYNYFQYLPLRGQSSYSGSALNSMINNKVSSDSKMKNTGNEFVKSQNTYGVNALLMTGIAANESGWGLSNIAKNKNNLFGLDAVDSSPGESANYFASVSQCIQEFARKWMSKEYLNPKQWKYFGGFLGNKASGMNVKYASDPYWGEKAAAMAWNLDKSNGNKDAYKHTIAIKDKIGPGNIVNVRKDAATSSTVLFKTPEQGNCAYIVLNDKPTNKFFKIQSDGVLNSNRTAIDMETGEYSYAKMYAYLSSDYINIISSGTTGGNQGKEGWKVEGGKTYYYENGQKIKGAKKIDGSWYYFNTSTGVMHTGWRTIGKDKAYYHTDGKLALGSTKISGSWYYFKNDGLMHTGWRTIGKDKAYYHTDGKLALGSTKISRLWYYFKNDGLMHIGWRTIGKDKAYYHTDGKLALGSTKINGSWYYFKNDGLMHTGWRTIGKDKAYYYADGKLAIGEVKIDGKWYQFDKTGLMIGKNTL